MTLTKKQKNQLIAGLIGVFILTLSLIIKSYFSKPESDNSKQVDTTKSIIQSPTINSISKDSSEQTVNQLNQVNQNNGDVKNDFSKNKKEITVTNNFKKSKSDTSIINNGNLSINQNGGVVNQTTVTTPPPRIFSNDDIQRLRTIPISDTVLLLVCNNSDESMKYGEQIFNYFQNNDHLVKVTFFTIGKWDRDESQKKFQIKPERLGFTKIYIDCQ